MKKLICSPALWLIFTGATILATVFTDLNPFFFILSLLLFLVAVLVATRQSPPPEKLALKLSAQAEEELKTTDFSARDVLVGTVRTAEQLDYCLRTKQYYVPASFMDNAPFPLDSIALHEEDIGTEPGIRWFGKIYTVELIKRANIPVPMRPGADPNEIYYQYAVESWQLRKPAITISGSYRGRPAFTNKFLFAHCTKTYQLFTVTSEKDYRQICLLDHIYELLYAGKAPEASYQLSQTHILTIKNGYLFVTDSAGWIREKTAVGHFLSDPKSLFLRIKKITRKTK